MKINKLLLIIVFFIVAIAITSCGTATDDSKDKVYIDTAFRPTDVSGLVLWLDIDSLEGSEDVESISCWPDKSPSKNNAYASAWASPQYMKNKINGKPAMSFNDSGHAYRLMQDIDVDSEWTVVFVYNDPLSTYNDDQRVLLANRDQGGRYHIEILHQQFGVYGFSGSGFYTTDMDEGAHVMSAITTANKMRYYNDRYPVGVTINNSENSPIAWVGNNGGGCPFGYVGEVIIYKKALTEKERSAVEQYLIKKWNRIQPLQSQYLCIC